MKAKTIVKRTLSSLRSISGIHSLLQYMRCSSKAFVLMYHRVLARSDNQETFVQPGMFVTTATFEKQISYLRQQFKIVYLEDLLEKMQNGVDIGGLCSITFDDGWRDNYSEAFPVLKKYSVPATIYLATGFVGTDRIFWPEEMCHYIESTMVNTGTFDGAPVTVTRFNDRLHRYRTCNREYFLDSSVEILKTFFPGEREEILQYFRTVVGTNRFCRQMMSWDEAREMHASGLVRFGSHTHNHEILDQVPYPVAKNEITRSRDKIQQILGNKVRTFAYPNGNHNERIRKILEKEGFDAAVTTSKGFVSHHTGLMEIPRISIHEDVSNTVPLFRSRILLQ